jgi:hypothetical protein
MAQIRRRPAADTPAPISRAPISRTPAAPTPISGATRTIRPAAAGPAEPGLRAVPARPSAAPRPQTGPRPPTVALMRARGRLSAELLAAMLEVDQRASATLDDIERADALAERLLARRRAARRDPGRPPPAARLARATG